MAWSEKGAAILAIGGYLAYLDRRRKQNGITKFTKLTEFLGGEL
jgi:hypothetical protein